ncbi:MAG: CocE/NonD family hydrolase [Xanthomonadales bacterium]|nr:CocE/NonD family hydrolase [Xanthomonadales bacterium]
MNANKQFPCKIVERESDLWIPLSDGIRLAAKLWLPADASDSPVPALLEFLPYRKRDLTRLRDEPIHKYFAEHGYASIRVDMRGSGDSFGVMRDEYELQEQEDGLEVIAWLAAQEWCSGSVGMFGVSWGGFNALQIAARRPPALGAIIASCFTDDRYADDLHYMGGCLLVDQLDWGTLFLSILPMPGDPEIMGNGWEDNWKERLEVLVPPAELWMEHQTRDAYWKHGSLSENYDDIQCPVFAVSGWIDGYSNAVPRSLEHLKVPRMGIIGAHAHQFGFEDRPPGPAWGFLDVAIRWWDRWLKEQDNGITEEPMLRAYMGENIPAKSFYETCPGRWIAESVWPSPRISNRTLYLNEDGLEDAALQSRPLVHIPVQTIGMNAGKWCPFGTGAGGADCPGDQRYDDALSLVFDTPLLEQPLEVVGAPVVTLDVSVDRPSAFVSVRLNDVKPDGTSTRVSFGFLNLAHRDSHEFPQAVVPNKRYRVRVQLNDLAYSFKVGHRIRISISTAYFPMVWPSPEPVTLKLYPGLSQLELPVRPAGDEEPVMHEFPKPTAAASPQIERLEAAPRENLITLKPNTSCMEVYAKRGGGYWRYADSGIETGRNMSERLVINQDDPLSAQATYVFEARTGRKGWIVDIKAQSRLSADKEEFLLESTLTIEENGKQVFHRIWERKFPRGHL